MSQITQQHVDWIISQRALGRGWSEAVSELTLGQAQQTELQALVAAQLLRSPAQEPLPPVDELRALKSLLWVEAVKGSLDHMRELRTILQSEVHDVQGQCDSDDSEPVERHPAEVLRMVPISWLRLDRIPESIRPSKRNMPSRFPSESYLRAILASIPVGWIHLDKIPKDWR